MLPAAGSAAVLAIVREGGYGNASPYVAYTSGVWEASQVLPRGTQRVPSLASRRINSKNAAMK